MSGNQKQSATGGPQTQRYSSAPSPYQPMPPQPARADGFHVSTPSYVQQQGNQTGNQVPALRGIAPTGPPNQASTPPNTDLKVQSVPQPTSLNHLFVNPSSVRGAQTQFYRGATPSQTPRMPNRQGQQQMYQQQAHQYVQMPTMPPVYLTPSNPMQYYPGQRQPYVSQMPVFAPYFPQPQAQPNSVAFPYFPTMGIRPPPTQNSTTPHNAAQQTMPNMPMTQPAQPPPPSSQRTQNKRRAHAVPIIDPATGIDLLNEVLDQDNSHPASGESSARQTPQPGPPNHAKEVQATFAKQVAQLVTGEDNAHEYVEHHSIPSDHIDQSIYNPSQAVHNPSRLETLVQSSNLKAQAKEFVLPPTPKEPPIVSANCDAVEVTLPNKPPKDRESPAKVRKPLTREHKDSVKEQSFSSSSSKDTISDKQTSNVKDERQKEVTAVPVSNKDKDSSSHQRDDKKAKKENDAETKVPVIEANDVAAVSNASPAQPTAQDVKVIAKSRNASRTKENQKQLPPQTASKQTVVVPSPQPAKPNNKSSKKSELNQKGASKEGTDMDVFNDNVNFDTVNANVVNNSINNDIINANAVTNNNNDSTLNSLSTISSVVNKDTKKIESNEMVTIKPEPKMTLTKNNYDITSIVKENHNPPLHFPAPVELHSETDRSAINEKAVKTRNEVNETSMAKVNHDFCSTLDGIMRYSRDALLKLKESPLSNIKPDRILDILIPDERLRLNERLTMGGGRDFVNPPFSSYGGKSGSQRGAPPKRNSQSGKLGSAGGKGNKSNSSTMPKLSISLRDEVKLHQAENAWKPLRFMGGEDKNDVAKQTEELNRKVRGILNKLTPEKFGPLVSQVQSLDIDTADKLQGVINLVFEKAVDEPNFSVAYALMCKELALMQVPTANSTEEKREYVNFRKLLITRCQQEFEKNSVDESVRNTKIAEIEQCEDPEKKKMLQEDLNEYDRKLRMKSVGNIRFIGELFKQSMLTANIMYKCLTNLIENKDEESLECLCKLLSTVGKELEMSKGLDLSPIFTTMKEIVDKKHGRISSRVRFMLQDVLDLKKSKWVPRRQDSNPKTIDQIQKEHENEQLNIQVMNSVPAPPRKDDRSGGGSNSGHGGKQRKNIASDDGWTTRGGGRSNQFNIERDKLKNKPLQMDERLGSSQMFGNWIRGSNIKTPQNSLSTNANMYAPLENMESDKRPMAGKSSRDPYSSKGASMERTFNKQGYDGRGSRSGSQQRSEASTPSSHRSTSGPMTSVPVMKPVQPAAPIAPVAAKPTIKLTQEQLERRVKNNLEEYVNDSCTMEDYDKDTRQIVPATYYPTLVINGYLNVLDRSRYARLKTSKLFAYLIKEGTLSLEDYCTGLEEVLSQTEDLSIDIPKIWEYMPQILVSVLCEEALPLRRLHDALGNLVKTDYAAKIIIPLFKSVIEEKGPNFLQHIWQASGLSLHDFMPSSEVDNAIQQHDLGFLAGGKAPIGVTQLSYEQIQEKLEGFFKSNIPFDDVVNWISANVGERVSQNKFIRVLATAIFEDSVNGGKTKLNSETLQEHYKLLHKYVDNNPSYELQCLYALQAWISKLLYPKGILFSICNQLYEDGALSQESFLVWEKSKDPAEQEGKGPAIKQLVSFFTQLQENDDDEECEEGDGSTGDEET